MPGFASVRLWWKAVRPFAYPASVVPVLLGIAVAGAEGAKIRIGLALLTVVGAVAAHTGANLMADYFDFRRGQDRAGTLGGSGLLVDGTIPAERIFTGALIAFAIAFLVGVPLVLSAGWPLALIILAGFVIGAGYSLPPLGLKYRALGDAAVFLAFGVGITLGSYVVQTGHLSWVPTFYAIPVGMQVAGILHANNLRDIADDRAVRTKTLAGLAGEYGSRWLYVFYVLGAYAVLALFLITDRVLPGAAAAFLTLPLGLRLAQTVWRAPYPARDAIVMADAQTAQLNLIFGLAMIAGIVAWVVFR